jgi:hypothetical protein
MLDGNSVLRELDDRFRAVLLLLLLAQHHFLFPACEEHAFHNDG